MSEHLSRMVNEFHGRVVPEPIRLSGYAGLINHYRWQRGAARRINPIRLAAEDRIASVRYCMYNTP